jgi:hydrogenase nickel incorporation protein HypA/HybF
MHELGIVQQLLEIVGERSGGARVHKIVMEVGMLSAVLPDALMFAFDVAREGTVADQATLEIISIPGSARCCACSAMLMLTKPYGRCACGSSELDWQSGEELNIRQMELLR